MATTSQKDNKPERHCLVTIGATARFTQLLQEALEPTFLSHLVKHNFTHLTLQCGADVSQIQQSLPEATAYPNLNITVFDFRDDLIPEMVKCRAAAPSRVNGMVIAHAGTGTILDCLRVSAPLIVVPNPTLKDNHQAELAEEIQSQGYATLGRLGHLTQALEQSDVLAGKNAQQFPAHPLSLQEKQVDIWSVSGAMMDRYDSPRATELQREEAAHMAMD